jgi:hypothetical protein
MYRAWLNAEDKGRVGLSGEVRALFESSSTSIQQDLAELLGPPDGSPSLEPSH